MVKNSSNGPISHQIVRFSNDFLLKVSWFRHVIWYLQFSQKKTRKIWHYYYSFLGTIENTKQTFRYKLAFKKITQKLVAFGNAIIWQDFPPSTLAWIRFFSVLFDEIFTIVLLQDLLATPMHEASPGCKWIGAASSNTISSGTTYRAIWSPSKLIMGRTLHRAFLLFSFNFLLQKTNMNLFSVYFLLFFQTFGMNWWKDKFMKRNTEKQTASSFFCACCCCHFDKKFHLLCFDRKFQTRALITLAETTVALDTELRVTK